ncbi:MAG: hypothetical protein ACXWCY_13185 [Burkholderiales bacterium]
MTECVQIAGWIAQAVSFPIIIDGDTGHGRVLRGLPGPARRRNPRIIEACRRQRRRKLMWDNAVRLYARTGLG